MLEPDQLTKDGLRVMRAFMELKDRSDRLKVIALAEKLSANQSKGAEPIVSD